MKISLVHDLLISIAGGEKVLDALCSLYDAPIYTLFSKESALQKSSFANHSLHHSFLQKLPKIHSYYRNLLPLFPLAISQFDLSGYDLILSSSHAVAKGEKTRENQIHICYCHTPMRYSWDLQEFHISHLNPLKKWLARPILKYLRAWDRKTHTRVDHFIANSQCVAKIIAEHYNRKASVIYPPVDTHLFPISKTREDYYFTCSRLVPYKRIDLLIKAFAQMSNRRLIIIGDGPEMKSLKAMAPKNVELLGKQSDDVLREILSRARAFVFAAEEDFGICVVEAQAAGIPVIAFGKGGALETVLSEKTGIFFEKQTPENLIKAIEYFERIEGGFDPKVIQKNAERFSKERFQTQIQNFVSAKIREFGKSNCPIDFVP